MERIGAEVAGFRGRLPLLCPPTARALAGAALLLAAGAATQAAKARARGSARPRPYRSPERRNTHFRVTFVCPVSSRIFL